jgi:hypothetical protein
LSNNIRFAENFFSERGIPMDVTIAEVDSGHFVSAVLDHAQKTNADLIAIMNLSRGNIFGVLGVPYEQEVITNQAMIPVMLMNPRESAAGSSWSFQ